jgi:hypothetical protein
MIGSAELPTSSVMACGEAGTLRTLATMAATM